MWKNLSLMRQNIVTQTEKAILIKIPKKTCKALNLPANTTFWHPIKIVRAQDEAGWCYKIGITEDFEIKVFKKGEGRYNFRETIFSSTLSGADLIEHWSAS